MATPSTFPRVETRIRVSILATMVSVLMLTPALVTAHPEGGLPQTKSQQKCTNKVNSSWSKVSKTTRKSVQKCLNNYAKGAPLTSFPSITTLEECIIFDAGGKIAKTKDKTSDTFDKSCGGPARDEIDSEGFPVFPDYGVSTVPTVNAAGQQMEIDLIHDLFGADLDAAGVLALSSGPGDSADAAKCQKSVVKSMGKCIAERQKQFAKCAKARLKTDEIAVRIYDPDDLALCFDGMDPTKIMKKCDGIPGQGIGKTLQKQCADKVTDRTLSAMFPECGTDDVETLATCLGQRAACRLCLSANAADDATRDCDLFDDNDTDNESCLPCAGAVAGFDSTYDGIQTLIFDSPTYGCSSALCHGAASQGGLNLTDDPNTPVIESHANLVNVPGANASPPTDRVEPGEPVLSFLYNKLAAGVDPNHPTGGGSSMPSGGATALTPEHLEAIEKWIRGGAPEDLTVEGTAVLLGSCLPEADPLTIPVPDPPLAGTGLQFTQTAWDLPSQFEDEICMATLYDLTGTGLVPAAALVTCPDEFLPGRCTGGANDPDNDACTVLADCPDQGGGTDCDLTLGMVNNPTGTCFAYKKQILAQDPQSHHSIMHIYTGRFDTDDAGWGGFTYKFQDPNDPLNGLACDPTDFDATGQNDGCSGFPQSAAACLGYGPPDYTFGGGLGFGVGGTAPMITRSQEPFYSQEYPAGVYSILPMGGLIVWNSHAFNLTQTDSTLSAYLNLDFALGAGEQLDVVESIFDAASIFWQPLGNPDNTVPPFTTREFCRTYTIPPDAELFELGSHTHETGVLWRTWAPPNTPCVPGAAACVPRIDVPLYLSTDYADPLQLLFDPPISHSGGLSVAARTYLFCSQYDNGSTPASPGVKRRSTSPSPPLGLPVGGPCSIGETQCIGGPNHGTLCSGIQSICDSSPGAGDGDCDACPMRGGLTTKDEMFILLGNYFIP